MAAKVYKRQLTFESIARLTRTMQQLAEVTGVPAATMPAHDRDPELLTAYRLDALANWTDNLLKHFEAAKPKPAAKVAKEKATPEAEQMLSETRLP
jgi:hypothetical protein